MSDDPVENHAGEEPPTTELVRGARVDPQAGFAAVYERVAPAVHAWSCLRIRPSLGHVVSPEDVVQEVWCRALRRFESYDRTRSSFRAWIFRIAELVLIEMFRDLKGRGSRVALHDRLDAFAEPATSLSRRLASDERLRLAVEQLSVLPREDQRLLIYRGLEDLPHEEVAARLGLTPAATRKKWERLRQKLLTLDLPSLLLES